MIAPKPLPTSRSLPWLTTLASVRPDWRALLAFALPFCLYLLTMAPTVYNLDSAELTTAAATGGIVRATGYPLYLLLGRVWALLPIGDVGFRMNLFSALCGALTVALTERLLRRWQIGPWATFGALGLLTVSTFFWALSLIAEVYTLHTLLMVTILLLLLRWAEQPTPKRLALLALVVGLSLGHHAATVLLLPGCAWYLLTVAPRQLLAPRALVAGGAALLAGATVYLYLPLVYSSQPAFNYAGLYDATGTFQPVNLHTPAGLWWLVSGKAFTGVMLGYDGAGLWGEVRAYGVHLWRAFFAVGIGPGLLGLVLLLRRNWRLGGALLLMFALSAAFYIDYRVIDKDTMFLPTYIIWALWLAVGLQALLDWVSEEEAGSVWGRRALCAGIVAAVGLALVATWPQVALSEDRSARARGERVLALVEPDALLLGWWETIPVVEYLQQVEGQRPDVQAINRFLIPYDAMQRLVLREVYANRPVYMDVVPPGLLSQVRTSKQGILYRLYPRPFGTESPPLGDNR